MTPRRRRPRVQECVKKFHAGCLLCPADAYAVLDAHRPLPGSEGGKYVWGNVMTLCANCHRRVHDGEVAISGRFLCSAGYYVWRVTENGQERFVKDVRRL